MGEISKVYWLKQQLHTFECNLMMLGCKYLLISFPIKVGSHGASVGCNNWGILTQLLKKLINSQRYVKDSN